MIYTIVVKKKYLFNFNISVFIINVVKFWFTLLCVFVIWLLGCLIGVFFLSGMKTVTSWSQLPVPHSFVHFSPSLKYHQKLRHFKAFVKRVITSFISLFPLCFICLSPLACSLPLSLWFQLLLSFFVLMMSKKINFYADASTRERWEVIYSRMKGQTKFAYYSFSLRVCVHQLHVFSIWMDS